MTNETDRANEILERLGSEYRAHTHAPVNDTLLAIIEALPGYVDRLVAERLATQPEPLETVSSPPPQAPQEGN